MGTTTHATLIQALHHRYEQAVAALNAADLNQPPKAENEGMHDALGRVMDANMAEIDAIRALILRQMPITDADLTILIFHAHMQCDFMITQASPIEEDVKNLFDGIRFAFDYLMCEGRLSDEIAGTNTLAIAALVRNSCRAKIYGIVAEEVAP